MRERQNSSCSGRKCDLRDPLQRLRFRCRLPPVVPASDTGGCPWPVLVSAAVQTENLGFITLAVSAVPTTTCVAVQVENRAFAERTGPDTLLLETVGSVVNARLAAFQEALMGSVLSLSGGTGSFPSGLARDPDVSRVGTVKALASTVRSAPVPPASADS